MMARIAFQDFAYPNSEPDVLADPFLTKRGASIKEISASAFADLLSGPTLDVFIGQERRHWKLHLNLLCYHSSYFEFEFGDHDEASKVQDNEESSLELPDVDPRGFALLVKWLYQGQLDGGNDGTDDQKYEYAVTCQELYLICDKFDIFPLKNQAMDAYRASLHSAQLVPDAEELTAIYRASPNGSSMRRLMAQIAARQIMDPASARGAEAYRVGFENNTDFSIEVINAIKQMAGGMLLEDPTGGAGGCEWHDHSDGGSCVEGSDAKPSVHTRQRWQRKVRATASKHIQTESNHDRSSNDDLPHTPSNTPNGITATVSQPTSRLNEIVEESMPVKTVNGASPSAPKQANVSIAMNESRKLTPPTPQSKKSSPVKSNDEAGTPKKSPTRSTNLANHKTFPRRFVSEAVVFDTPKPIKGHVDGIVRQINGTRSPSEASSGRRPKKLELRSAE